MKALKSFMVTLIIVLIIGCIFIVARGSIMKNVRSDVTASSSSKSNPVIKAIVSKAIDSYIENTDNEKIQEIATSMSEEDKDAVTEIIANNVTIDSVSEVQSCISSGDTQSMIDYAKENLSEDEIEQLTDIMSKYVTP